MIGQEGSVLVFRHTHRTTDRRSHGYGWTDRREIEMLFRCDNVFKKDINANSKAKISFSS